MAGWNKSYNGKLLHYFLEDGSTACGKHLVERVRPQIPATGKCQKCEKSAQHSVQRTGLRRVLELCEIHDIHFVGSCPICEPPHR